MDKKGKTFSDFVFSSVEDDNLSSDTGSGLEKDASENLISEEKEKEETDFFDKKTVDFGDLIGEAKNIDNLTEDMLSDEKNGVVDFDTVHNSYGRGDYVPGSKSDNTEIISEKDVVIKNPFFDNSVEEHDEVSDEKSQDVVDTNVMVEEDLVGNPFFDSSIDEKKELENGDSAFDLKRDDGIVKDEVENPFFEQSNLTSNKDNSVQDTIGHVDENKKTVEEVSSVSENPFFEEKNEVSEANPLLLNTLNLVENKSVDKNPLQVDVTKSRHFDVKIVRKKEPLFKMIIGVLSYALFIWLLLVGVVLLIYVLDIKIRASKGDYSAPKYNAYVVLTGSMLPKIQVYDVVVTKKVDVSELDVGDVITFSSADSRFLGTIITHRIIKKSYDAETKSYSFQTKGDNNNVADSALVPQNNIFGKVILKIPKLGYLQEFLATDGGWIIVILLPCLAVISYDIVKLIKGMKRRKYKNIKVQK